MLKINKKVEYALIALKFVSQKKKEDLTTAREICEKFQLPFDTTAKVMQIMNNAEILDSIKGAKGGYSLKTSLKDITYMDLVRLIEKTDEDSSVCDRGKTCEIADFCNIVDPINALNTRVNNYLESINLESLFFGF